MRTVLASIFVLAALQTPVAVLAQPANDNCSAAAIIGALPFVDAPDTTNATLELGDPVHSCTGAIDGNTVWYEYSPASDTVLDIDTTGSPYGAVIAVYDGGCGGLVERGCFVDPAAADSRLPVTVTGGTTVLIQVSDPGLSGGILSLEAREAPFTLGAPVTMVEAVNSATLSTFGTGVGYIEGVTALSPRKFAFGAAEVGLFSEAGGVITKVASTGDPTPAGGTFSSFSGVSMVNAAYGAFYSSIEGLPGAGGAIFTFNGAVIATVTAIGDPAPTGGTFTSLGSPSMNLAGDIAFAARTSVAPISSIYVLPFGGALAAVASAGAASPCGGNFSTFGDVAINAFGALAFSAFSGGTDGIYSHIGGVTAAVACENDPEPSLGGIYHRFGNFAFSDVPEIVFYAEVDNGVFPNPDAIYAGAPGAVTAIASTGDVTFTGETIDRIDSRIRPAINNNSEVAFYTELTAPDRFGVAFVPIGGVQRIVAKRFDACGVGTIRHMGKAVAINNGGTVIAEASCGIGIGTIRLVPGVGLSKVAFHNDATTVGAGFSFEPGRIDAAGDTVLLGRRTAVHGFRCTTAGVCTAPQVLAAASNPWPIGGNTVRAILTGSVGGVRRPVFTVLTSGIFPSEAIAMLRGGLRSVVESGDPVPGGGGTFNFFSDEDPFHPGGGAWRPAGHGGRVAFAAAVTHPNFTRGIFIFRNGNIATIAGDGQPSPDGGVFVDFSSPAIAGSKVAFGAETSVGQCVMFARNPSTVTGVACSGDPAVVPGTTIGAILGPPTINRRDVVFAAEVVGGTTSQCLFAWNNGGLYTLACEGDPQPNGGTFTSFQSPDDDNVTLRGSRGDVAFSTADNNSELALHSWRKKALFQIAVNGAAAPAGGTLGLEQHEIATAKRTAVFSADVDGGTGNRAVFVARMP